MRIRYIDGDMPFDKDGRHATGREVYNESPEGYFHWDPEYEGDETEEFDVTEVVITEKELIKACVDLYRKNCSPEQTGMTGEKHFYYSSGNMNAINYICSRFGIDITKELENVHR